MRDIERERDILSTQRLWARDRALERVYAGGHREVADLPWLVPALRKPIYQQQQGGKMDATLAIILFFIAAFVGIVAIVTAILDSEEDDHHDR